MPTRPTSRRCGASRPSPDLNDDERRDLATVLRDVVIRFDNLWRMPFPYVMALHQAPAEGGRQRIPLSHRIPSAAAPAEPAQVPGRSRDRRRQLPQRHVAGGEGRRVGRCRRSALSFGSGLSRRMTTALPFHPLLEPIQALHRRIRDEVVRACEAGGGGSALRRRDRSRGRYDLRDRPRG